MWMDKGRNLGVGSLGARDGGLPRLLGYGTHVPDHALASKRGRIGEAESQEMASLTWFETLTGASCS
jgi:hypothetical protein